jgi:hypothetical protein
LRRIFANAGKVIPEEPILLSAEAIVPVHKMPLKRPPALRIEQERLLATRCPRLGNLDRTDPISSFVMRKYDIHLEKDLEICLRGAEKKVVRNKQGREIAEWKETGWETITKIAQKPQEFSMPDLLRILDNPAQKKAAGRLAYECGFNDIHHLRQYVLSLFTEYDEDIVKPDNTVIFFDVKPVEKIRYWTDRRPEAVMISKEDRYRRSRLKHHADRASFEPKTPDFPQPQRL